MSSGLTHRVVVRSPEGLHLRPADQLVRMASSYQCNIMIGKLPAPLQMPEAPPIDADDSGIAMTTPGEMLDCKSILSLLTLGAAQGDVLTLNANGPDASQAIDNITRWFESGFDSETPES